MARAALAWGGGVVGILAVGAVAVSAALALTAAPEQHVQRYLDALARDDLATAARLAGLEIDQAIPLGDEGEPRIRSIVETRPAGDGTVIVEAEYGAAGDAERIAFHLEPAPRAFGVIPGWQFVTPPITTLAIGVDQHDRLVVGDTPVTTPGPGKLARVTVFVPARVTVRLAEPLLEADAVTVRVTDAEGALGSGSAPLVLAARPSPALERAVSTLLDGLLADCAEQPVLKPAACPFGLEVDDRVTVGPHWTIDTRGPIELRVGDRAGTWRLRAEGSASAELTVQRLFDGVIEERTAAVAFAATGTILIAEGEARFELDRAVP